MNSAAKNVIVITSITVVAGLLLGFVSDITREPIAKQQLESKQKAYKAVFAEASSFEEDEAITIDAMNEYLASNGFEQESADEILVAKDSTGAELGHVFGVTTHEGYGGDISIYVGVDAAGTTKGIEILNISETAGLGMKADTDEFKSQFADRAVSRFAYTKTGKVQDYEIDALSGATITTNAMTNAVNAALCLNEKLGGGF